MASAERGAWGTLGESGLPSCVQSPTCGNPNEPPTEAGAAALLAAIPGPVWQAFSASIGVSHDLHSLVMPEGARRAEALHTPSLQPNG